MGDNEISDKKWLRMPSWARKILIVAAIAGPVGTAVTTSVSTYYKVKAAKKEAAEAKEKTTSGYDTLAPAVEELQEILNEAQEWAEETDVELRDIEADDDDFERRIIRLETYIEILSQRRNSPRLPDRVRRWETEEPMASMMPGLPTSDGPPIRKAKKSARPIPRNIDQAHDYQQQRIEMDCPPDDPLCGI
jgi:septal ring factor EnvC (AmiA/AmiB activator)